MKGAPRNTWGTTAAKANAYDAANETPVNSPLGAPNRFVKWSMVPAGVLCAYLVFAVQMSKPAALANSGLLLFCVLMYVANWLYPTLIPDKTVTTPTPASFSHYFGPYAATLVNSFFWTTLVVDVLWAYRWLAGVEFVCKGVYNLDPGLIKNLTECGQQHPFVESQKTCHVLGSFLNKPWSLYVHAFGGVTALALGPFQFWGWFRKTYTTAHRIMGYLYATFVVIGTVGAGMLISQTTSGMLVAIGFTVLACGWIVYLAVAIYHIKGGRMHLHKEYMIRQYTLTFSAVPFRFLPAVLQGSGIDPESAYWMGAYLTVIWGYVFGEVFVRYLRRNGHSGDVSMQKLNEAEGGLSMAEVSPPDNGNKA